MTRVLARDTVVVPAVMLASLAFVSEFNVDVAAPVWNKVVKWAVVATVWLAPVAVYAVRSAVLPDVLVRPPLRWVGIWMVWSLLAAAWSVASVHGPGLLITLGVISCWLFPVWFVSVFGWQPFVRVLVWGAVVFLGGSIVYAVLGDPLVAWHTTRMSGVSWSPTTLGRVGGLTVILGLLVASTRSPRIFSLGTVAIVLGVACVLASGTVTSVVGLVAVAVLWLLRAGRHGQAVGLLVAAGAAAITTVWVAGAGGGALLGDLITATGRSEIWSATLRLARDAPLLGYGTGSGEAVFDELARNGDLAWRAFTAHSTFLHVLLTQGLVGLGLLLAAVVSYVRVARRVPDTGRDALVLFLLVNSFTEALVEQPSLSIVVAAGAFAAAANSGHGNASPTLGRAAVRSGTG